VASTFSPMAPSPVPRPSWRYDYRKLSSIAVAFAKHTFLGTAIKQTPAPFFGPCIRGRTLSFMTHTSVYSGPSGQFEQHW